MITTDNKEIVIDALVRELFKSCRQIDFSGLSLGDRSTIAERLGDLHWERYQQEDGKEMLDKSLEYYLLSGAEEKTTKAARKVIEGSNYFRARIEAVRFLQSKGELDYLKEKIALRLPIFLTEPGDSLPTEELDLYRGVLGTESTHNLIARAMSNSKNMKSIYKAARCSGYTDSASFWVSFEERCFQLEDFAAFAEAVDDCKYKFVNINDRDLAGARAKAVQEANIEQARALAWLQQGGKFKYKYRLGPQEYLTMALKLREQYVHKRKGEFSNAGFHWTDSKIYQAKELLEEANTPESWKLLSDWAQELLSYTKKEDSEVIKIAFSAALNSGDEQKAAEVFKGYYSPWGLEQALKQATGHPLLYQACQETGREWGEQLIAEGSRDSLNVAEKIYNLLGDASGLESVRKERERNAAKHIAFQLNIEDTPENLDAILKMGTAAVDKLFH